MAGTATHLHSVPTPAPAPLRRGNHPAGRALRAPAGVVPLPRPLAEVVPLRPRPPVADERDRVRRSAAAGQAAPVRLTRRGRRVVAGLGLGAALALVGVVGGAVVHDGGSPALELAGRSTVTVHSGDTLWSIAEALAPHSDPRAVVDALQEANGLADASLVPGQVLVVP